MSSLWVMLDIVGTYSRGGDPFGAAAFEARYNEFRKTVKPHTTLGYVSDNRADDAATQAEYYLTQYTLAPAIVKSTPSEQLVVANFHNDKSVQAALQSALTSQRLVLVQEYGSGIALYRKTQQ